MMKKWNGAKRVLASLLVVGMLAGSTVVSFAETEGMPQESMQLETEEMPQESVQPETEAPEEETAPKEAWKAGRTFFQEGAFSDQPITSMEDAAQVLSQMSEQIGTDERTHFEPWRALTDTNGNNYYVFRQMYGDVTVSGGAVKVVTDADGKMLGLVSSLETKLPEEAPKEEITAQEAEAVVDRKMKETGHEKIEIMGDFTEKVILPVNLELDPESQDEKEEVRFVWVVYTNNDSSSLGKGSDLPYLAHYVGMDGEYLYSLPTIIPNDEAGDTGFGSSYVFEFMEPAQYTGTVTLSDGTEKEISIELMRDSRTGMYYLGNLERRIVVADCWEFLYNKGNVVLEASPDNTGWDSTCLLSLYNYCRAWDYYNAIGWKGGDGLGTPIMILKDYCDREHEPVDNAAYAGLYYGWQMFLSSSANDFSQCLDVLGHEFTHCVTGSVMTYNAYSNDYGAINEAMSDIQGNICEMLMGATEDTTWELGENSSNPVRNMSDPHKYQQPEYSWDLYYTPEVKTPTAINDRGGVHTNSSLLNQVAWMLCEKGMTLEEARAFWFAVDCSMVPGTDYAQLSQLMPWVLKNVGLEKYTDALEEAITVTKIRDNTRPESFPEDQALITLELPDTQLFRDGNWALQILSVDADRVAQQYDKIINNKEDGAGALDELGKIMWDNALSALISDEGKAAIGEELGKWLRKYFDGTLTLTNAGAGADGRTIQVVSRPGYTIPLLMYMKFNPTSVNPEKIGFAIYIMGQWIDVTGQLTLTEAEMEQYANELVEMFENSNEEVFYKIEAGTVNEIPTEGLGQVAPLDANHFNEMVEEGRAE